MHSRKFPIRRSMRSPTARTPNDNVEHHRFGAKREYAFGPKQHFELGEALGQMDFETAAKLSGARFVVLKKGLARLERALGQFMLDVHISEHSYTEIAPPLMVKDESMFGTAQLPKFKDDQFQTALIRSTRPKQEEAKRITDVFRSTLSHWLEQKNSDDLINSVRLYWQLADSESVPAATFRKFTARVQQLLKQSGDPVYFRGLESAARLANTAVTSSASNIAKAVLDERNLNDRLWLIPTAEVPLTNFVREEIVEELKLPIRLTALTPCFRRRRVPPARTRAA